MTRKSPALATLLLLAAALALPTAATAQDCPDEARFERHYWDVGVASEIVRDAVGRQQDFFFVFGNLFPSTCGARWMARTDLFAGFRSGGFSTLSSPMAGLQLQVGHGFAQPGFEMSSNRRGELFIMFGGAGYVAHNMPEAPERTSLIPGAGGGIGFRLTGGDEGLLMIELQYERRFRDFDDRVFARLTVALPG